MTDKEFLTFIYERMVYKYNENESFDYMVKFKNLINKM